MSRRVIAPTLRLIMRGGDVDHAVLCASNEAREAFELELRALLALYSAAKREGGPECECGVCRAARRVERVSTRRRTT